MCHCLEDGCTPQSHGKFCWCARDELSKNCCLTLECKRAAHDSGHNINCKDFKKCLCLEAGCSPKKHKLPCVCTQTCTCTVYHCKLNSGCCDRKPHQKCRYYRVELCEHCDYLRRHAMTLQTYNTKTKMHTCECDCDCDYECDGYCKKCETHSQQGWNLLSWQRFRKPVIFIEQPKFEPYYLEDVQTGKQVTICCECKKEKVIMKTWYWSCHLCFDAVCLSCCNEYEHSRTDVDYNGNCLPYWRFEPEHCRKAGNHTFWWEKNDNIEP